MGSSKWLGTASLFVPVRLSAADTLEQQYIPGTTGFDVVGSWVWLRVEVPGGLVKHPGKT
jgi:hypothetical protein